MLIFNKILKLVTDIQDFVRIKVSLKCRNSYLKLIFYRSCFECIERIRIWLFWCIVTWLSLPLWCNKNFLSMLRWLQNSNYFYVWQKSLPYSLKNKFFPVPSGVLARNFVWCYPRALVKVRGIISRNATSKSREVNFDI